MAIAAARKRSDSGRARLTLGARLEARREEIEAAALTRVRAIADPSEVSDPAYAGGLRAAVAAAIDYGIEAAGRGVENAPPIPVALLAQARLAARVGIPLDTVLRRYFAGYSLLGYYLMEEASREGLMDGADLQRLIAAQAGNFDRLLAAIGEEHGRESGSLRNGFEHRQAEQIERLLAGEMVDTSGITYEFDGWHIGLVTVGRGVEQRVRALAASLDCRVLCVPRARDTLWAWLGARRRLDPDELLARLSPPGNREAVALGESRKGLAMALGEPAERLPGWRLTHRQAVAALGVARHGSGKLTRYADVALLATALQDDLLAESLRRLYLDPLEAERDSGTTLRETLRAYLARGRNVSSAASALGVNRNTATSRLRTVERRIGRSLDSCAAELEVALSIERLVQQPDEPAV